MSEMCRILLVDGDQNTDGSATQLLELCGHNVSRARSLEEAIKVAASFRPHIVLVDVATPKLDALALAAAVRAAEGGERVYVVALTERSEPEVTTVLRGTGFDAHLIKPVDTDALEEMLTARCHWMHERGFAS